MKITLARHSGFCMGVRKAVLKIIHELQETDEEILVFGPLIHNPQTLELLKARGLKTIDSLDAIDDRLVAVRSHGIPVDEYRDIKNRGRRVINLTCPRVAKVQSIIKKYSSLGHFTIIVGDRDHAEVIGLMSYAARGCVIVSEMKDIASIPKKDKYIVVAQTTADRQFFSQVMERLNRELRSLVVVDTICDSTRNRQEDVLQGIADGIDTLIVVGGKNSANTKRLALLGEKNGVTTIYVESGDDIDEKQFAGSNNVLVTAGASTPGWIISGVLERLHEISNRKTNLPLFWAVRILEILVKTNFLASLGAAAITSLTGLLAGGRPDHLFAALSCMYIFSMYSVNNYLERDSFRITNPLKYRILKKTGRLLLLTAFLAMSGSFFLAWSRGPFTVAALLVSSFLGAAYSTAPIRSIIGKSGSRLLSRLYSSRIASSFGWVIVTVIMPLWHRNAPCDITAGYSLAVFSLLFMRQSLTDIIAFQGDLILGRETLAIVLEVPGIRRLFLILMAAAVPSLLYLSVIHNPFSLLLLANLLYFGGVLFALEKSSLTYPLKYEIIVESNFILVGAGLLAAALFTP